MYTDLLTTKIIYKTHGCWVFGYGVLFVFGLFEINSYNGIILYLMMELNSIDVVTLDYSEYLRMSSNSGIILVDVV